jgi:hypothetical protein
MVSGLSPLGRSAANAQEEGLTGRTAVWRERMYLDGVRGIPLSGSDERGNRGIDRRLVVAVDDADIFRKGDVVDAGRRASGCDA